MPKVSVLTSAFNTNPDHLRQCIDSILNQTFTDFEFLILNDSPDNTEIDDVVASYDDARIRYIKNDKNIGISQSRNKLLSMATGQYIAIFDHDDISMPNRLELQVAYMDAHPEIGVVSAQIQAFGDADWITHNPEYDTDIKIWLTLDCFVAHTAAMIRTSVIRDNNIKYDYLYSPAEDYHLWWQLMRVTRFYNIQQVLAKYRCHIKNTSARLENDRLRYRKAISLEIRNMFPAYWAEMQAINYSTSFRLRLFGFIPLLKIKNSWVQLFEFIPIFKIRP